MRSQRRGIILMKKVGVWKRENEEALFLGSHKITESGQRFILKEIEGKKEHTFPNHFLASNEGFKKVGYVHMPSPNEKNRDNYILTKEKVKYL
jgi:hypothetical protein